MSRLTVSGLVEPLAVPEGLSYQYNMSINKPLISRHSICVWSRRKIQSLNYASMALMYEYSMDNLHFSIVFTLANIGTCVC